MSNYFGQTPDPTKDPYDRRKVKQLNDISFEESSGDEYEDLRDLKRLPKTIITEENLKENAGPETEKLNLEHHYWIKDGVLDKIGRMAKNLKELSLRRMKIQNNAFTNIVSELKFLEKIDISDCPNIQQSGVIVMLDNNQSMKEIQAHNCR